MLSKSLSFRIVHYEVIDDKHREASHFCPAFPIEPGPEAGLWFGQEVIMSLRRSYAGSLV